MQTGQTQALFIGVQYHDKEQWAQTEKKEASFLTSITTSLLWGWLSIITDCPNTCRPWSLHSWRYSKAIWTFLCKLPNLSLGWGCWLMLDQMTFRVLFQIQLSFDYLKESEIFSVSATWYGTYWGRAFLEWTTLYHTTLKISLVIYVYSADFCP